MGRRPSSGAPRRCCAERKPYSPGHLIYGALWVAVLALVVSAGFGSPALLSL